MKNESMSTTTDLSAPDGSFSAFQVRKNETLTSNIVRLKLNDLSPGEVVIRTAFAGVNYKDALATTEHGRVIQQFPRVVGSDASGTVVASTDSAFRPGDEVVIIGRGFGVAHDGGFSEFIRAPASWVTKLPSGMNLFTAAALGIAGYTAGLAVHLLQEAGYHPKQGKVLVNGATGAVSSMGIEMLSSLGYTVTAMTSKAEQSAYLTSVGAREIISPSNMPDSGKPLDKGQWAAALDALGGHPLSLLLRSIMPRGCVASFGNVVGNELTTSVLPFILRGIRLIGVNVTYYLDIELLLWQRLANDLKPHYMLGTVHTIPLGALPEQLERMLSGKTLGRTVVDFSI